MKLKKDREKLKLLALTIINYLELHPAGILTGFSINFHQISGFYKQWHLNNSASFQGCCFCSRLGAIASDSRCRFGNFQLDFYRQFNVDNLTFIANTGNYCVGH